MPQKVLNNKAMPPPSLTPQNVAERLHEAGFALDAPVVERLVLYLDMLCQWNKVMNLVGPKDWVGILDSLVMDSFHLAALIHSLKLPSTPTCWDFGAGAGLPGIPLRLLWQEGEYIMVEAREKRALFLQAALARLDLPGVRVSPCRVEDFMPSAAPAHLLLSRAFMPWEKLLALAAGHLTPDGAVLFMASAPAPQPPPALAAHWYLQEDRPYPSNTRTTAHFWIFRSLSAPVE